LLALRRARAQKRGVETFLLDHIAHDLAERLSVVLRKFDVAADIGTPGDAVRNLLTEHQLAGRVISASTAPGAGIAADEEALPFADGSLDLAVSALSLHFVNDLPGALIQIRRALKPDGLFVGCLLGGATLTELRQAFALAEAEVEPEVEVVCDVRTPFEDAARVFGPQKGADPAMVERLTERLHELARAAPRDPRGVPMTGCAGGLSGALWAHFGATLVHGAAYVLDAIGFDERMRDAAFVVTGEGRLDASTLQGKICGELATRCRQAGIACHAIVGRDALEPFEERIIDLQSVTEARTLEELEAAGRALVS
jgi:hypothetical protein